jgi:LmbE family N-acetylglucosaminyl deacetylase
MSTAHTKPTVVFIVAHPDDIAFLMPGTATLLKQRYALHVVCASKGERGYRWDGEGTPPPSDELAAKREKEERAACALIDAEITFLGLIDGEIYAEREVCRRVADILTELKPVAVLTLHPLSKPDHAAASLIARQALHLCKRYWETELYMVTREGEVYHPFGANIFVNTEGVQEARMALVRCHPSQLHDPEGYAKRVQRPGVMARMSYCERAEAFMTELPAVGTRWSRRAGSILLDLE